MHKNSTQIPQSQDFLLNFQAGKAFQVAFLRKIPTKPEKPTLRLNSISDFTFLSEARPLHRLGRPLSTIPEPLFVK
jgi:hypothetical protein